MERVLITQTLILSLMNKKGLAMTKHIVREINFFYLLCKYFSFLHLHLVAPFS